MHEKRLTNDIGKSERGNKPHFMKRVTGCKTEAGTFFWSSCLGKRHGPGRDPACLSGWYRRATLELGAMHEKVR